MVVAPQSFSESSTASLFSSNRFIAALLFSLPAALVLALSLLLASRVGGNGELEAACGTAHTEAAELVTDLRSKACLGISISLWTRAACISPAADVDVWLAAASGDDAYNQTQALAVIEAAVRLELPRTLRKRVFSSDAGVRVRVHMRTSLDPPLLPAGGAVRVDNGNFWGVSERALRRSTLLDSLPWTSLGEADAFLEPPGLRKSLGDSAWQPRTLAAAVAAASGVERVHIYTFFAPPASAPLRVLAGDGYLGGDAGMRTPADYLDLSSASSVLFFPPLEQCRAVGGFDCLTALADEVVNRTVDAAARLVGVSEAGCVDTMPASCIGVERLVGALERVSEICDVAYVIENGSGGDAASRAGAARNLVVQPAFGARLAAVVNLVREVATALLLEGGRRRLVDAAGVALAEARALSADAGIGNDATVSSEQLAAIFLSPWAPLLLPLLLALAAPAASAVSAWRVRRGAGAAAAAAAAASAADRKTPKPEVVLRDIQRGDNLALQRLYVLGQLQHAVSPAAERAHAAWTRMLMRSDLADAHAYYVDGEQRARYLGRATFIVATIARADFEAALVSRGGEAAAAAAAGTAWCGHLLAISPPHACAADCVATTCHAACQACLRRLLDTSDADGRVVVGCLALKPYMTPAALAAARSAKPSAAASTASTAAKATEDEEDDKENAHGPPRDPAVLAALNRSRACELERMAVHPLLRRAGVASTLLARAEAWSRSVGFSRIVLSTLATMKPGLALYQRHGFRCMPGWPIEGVEHDSHGDRIFICWLYKELLPLIEPRGSMPPAAA